MEINRPDVLAEVSAAFQAFEQALTEGYGRSVAVVTTLFGYPGGDKLGRQSQTWGPDARGLVNRHRHVSEPAG